MAGYHQQSRIQARMTRLLAQNRAALARNNAERIPQPNPLHPTRDARGGGTLFENAGPDGRAFVKLPDNASGVWIIPSHSGPNGQPDRFNVVRDAAPDPAMLERVERARQFAIAMEAQRAQAPAPSHPQTTKDTSMVYRSPQHYLDDTRAQERRTRDHRMADAEHAILRSINAANASFWSKSPTRDGAPSAGNMPGIRGDNTADMPYDLRAEHNSIPAAVRGSTFSGGAGNEMLRRGATEMGFAHGADPIPDLDRGAPRSRGPGLGSNASRAPGLLGLAPDHNFDPNDPVARFVHALNALPSGEPNAALNEYHRAFHAAGDRVTRDSIDKAWRDFNTHYDRGDPFAKRQHVSDAPNWQGIYQANKGVIGGDPNKIYPGQQLNVGGQTHIVQSGETLSGIAQKYNSPQPASGGAAGGTFEAPSHQTTPTAGALGAAASQAGGGSSSSAPLPPEKPAGLAQEGPGAGAMKGWADPGARNYTASNAGAPNSQIPMKAAENPAPTPPEKPSGLQQS